MFLPPVAVDPLGDVPTQCRREVLVALGHACVGPAHALDHSPPGTKSTVAAVWCASCSLASRTPASARSDFHSLQIPARVERLAVGLCEHPVALVPLRSG